MVVFNIPIQQIIIPPAVIPSPAKLIPINLNYLKYVKCHKQLVELLLNSVSSLFQNSKKPEYGTDSYNRPGKNKFIGPSRGLPGSILQKRGEQMRSSISKKQEQSMMKRHCKWIHFWRI